MNHKCFQCLKVGHTFRNCSEVACVCACVSQLASFPKNEHLDKVSELGPRFLQIRDEDIPSLLYPYKQINRFLKIRENEFLSDKVDRRRKVLNY
jgi:hypothetical protein